MTNVTIEAGTLTANREDRVVSGLLLPYGEVGRTNLGRFSVDRGVFEVPSDPLVLTANLAHKREDPVGRVLTTNDTEAGLFASFKIAATPEGDQLLNDIDDGKTKALSVEATGVVIRDGKAIKGRVFGAAFVDRGAFPSATLLAEDAGDDAEPTGDALPPEIPADSDSESVTREVITVDGVQYQRVTTSTYTTETTPVSDEPAGEPEKTEAPVPENLNAQAPAGGFAARRKAAPAITPGHLFAALAMYHRNGDRTGLDQIREAGRADTLFAALEDITFSGEGSLGDKIIVPDWVGQFWSGVQHQRVVVPQLGSKDLTAFHVKGWNWTAKPRMERWGGNKTAVPSNEVDAEPETFSAQPFAGAHDIAREMKDFPNPEFWEAYFTAMRESYAIESDAYALEKLVEAATPVTTGLAPIGYDGPDVLIKLVDAALAVNRKGVPTFAFLSESDWREYALTPKDHTLELLTQSLSSLSEGAVGGFKVLPTPYDQDENPVLQDGQVLVGTRAAATFRELPGSPIRVEGLDIAKGGIDPALFGYGLVQIDEPGGLALVDGSIQS